MTKDNSRKLTTSPPTIEGGLAEIDPTGQSEFGHNGLRYTEANARAVEEWREQEAAGELGSGAVLLSREIA